MATNSIDENNMDGEERMRNLELQNQKLTDDVVAITESQTKVVKGLVICQGLLSQFNKENVRNAFLKGKLGEPCGREMLASVDAVAGILLPSPSASKGREVTDDTSVNFILKLLARDAGEPVDIIGNFLPVRQSFKDWRNFMHTLVSSPFWGELDSCVRDFSGIFASSALDRSHKLNVAGNPNPDIGDVSGDVGPGPSKGNPSRFKVSEFSSPKCRKKQIIAYTSDDSEPSLKYNHSSDTDS